jgi:superfamily I DNA/RNA helicase
VRYVLKGRGLTDFSEYATLPRLGRFRALTGEQRALVWNLYREYELALQERQIFDWEDVILEAEASLAEEPLRGYSAVIVDEAQDLSCAMIRMLHGLAGDRPDALTLVSDGQQTIYPGGYTLAEAGVDIQGRGVVLRTNYRNTAEIIEFAQSLVQGDRAPDIEGGPASDDDQAEVLRHGARPVFTVFSSRSVHDRSLVERIRRIVAEDVRTRFGDIGVLALYSWHAREAAEALTEAGIPVIELEKYDGASVDAVKVGTIKRAKGLEFREVLVVRTPPHLVQADVIDPDEAAAERRLLQRRELYVAMTRAREGLWVGVA